MHIVYILKSTKNPNRHYVGVCNDLKARIAEHNSGECKTTCKGGPWKLETAIYFSDEVKANAFERYLKTGSGRAFSIRHL
jgi:putative endonuclease